jgi:hypothetical protein
MTRHWGGLILVAAFAASAWAQTDSRRATFKGSRGDWGKCTIEVNVDGVAEIEILGDRGELHTVAGAPANWVRFECNDTLPRGPEDFKFSGIDGRGRQTLLRDPRGNRGIAVVRLEDPKGGREGYTFDIEWRGYANSVTGGPGNGGRDFGRYDPNRYDDRTRGGTARAIDQCTEAVRAKANRDYGYRNIDIARVGFDDNPGRRDWVVGRFTYRRGLTTDEFEFSCSVDLNNGRVRNVDIRRW